MIEKGDGPTDLVEAIGRAAHADSQVDEWLVQVLAAVLNQYPVEIVRTLVAGGAGIQKYETVKRLLKQLQLDLQPEIAGAMRALEDYKPAKRDRDMAVHSFYDSRSGESPLQSFRSRSGTQSTNIDEIRSVASRLEVIAEALAQLTHLVERTYARAGDVSTLIEECRELLCAAPYRLPDDRLQLLRSGGELRLALTGPGQRRFLGENEHPVDGEILARLNTDNGAIVLELEDGTTVHGGDTGWRDVTSEAQLDDAEIELALIRRLNQNVSVIQQGGEFLAQSDFLYANTLADRVFGPTSADGPDFSLPTWVDKLEGFRPAT